MKSFSENVTRTLNALRDIDPALDSPGYYGLMTDLRDVTAGADWGREQYCLAIALVSAHFLNATTPQQSRNASQFALCDLIMHGHYALRRRDLRALLDALAITRDRELMCQILNMLRLWGSPDARNLAAPFMQHEDAAVRSYAAKIRDKSSS